MTIGIFNGFFLQGHRRHGGTNASTEWHGIGGIGKIPTGPQGRSRAGLQRIPAIAVAAAGFTEVPAAPQRPGPVPDPAVHGRSAQLRRVVPESLAYFRVPQQHRVGALDCLSVLAPAIDGLAAVVRHFRAPPRQDPVEEQVRFQRAGPASRVARRPSCFCDCRSSPGRSSRTRHLDQGPEGRTGSLDEISAAADLAMGQPGHDRGFHAPPVDELSGRGPYGDPSQAQRSQIPVE